MTKLFQLITGTGILMTLPCLASAQTPGTGRIQIKTIQTYSGATPLTKPTGIVVYPFAATPEQVELNKSALSRARMRRSGTQDDEKTQTVKKIVEAFSESLMKDLQKTSLPVSRGVAGDLPPDNTLMVQGDFVSIDEGNRARRMAIGLGAGASEVVTHVECFVKQSARNAMITEFQAISQSRASQAQLRLWGRVLPPT